MRIAIFDKKDVVRIGLKEIIKQYFNYQFIIDFYEIEDLKDFFSKDTTDLLIISQRPNSCKLFSLISTIISKNKGIKIIFFSDFENETEIFKCIKAGVSGFVEEKASVEDIIDAIKTVMNNEEYFSDSISNIVLNSYINNIKQGDEISEKKPRDLTRREIQILKLVSQGLTNKQIADGLGISIRTVNAHKNHIMQKLGLKTTADLVKFALKNNYVKF
jgi:two-component system response regulator NreC